MTEHSYALNATNGLIDTTGPVCLIAAFDRISNFAEVPPEVYQDYTELWRRAYPDVVRHAIDPHERVNPQILAEYANFRKQLYASLGVYSLRNVARLSIADCQQFTQVLGQLSAGGFRIRMNVSDKGNHTLGLIAAGNDEYYTRSTWSPFHPTQAVGSEELFEHLAVRPRFHRRYQNQKSEKVTNMIAIPPEASH